MSLPERIEAEKSLAAAVATATAVAKDSKAAHKAAAERLARYKIYILSSTINDSKRVLFSK